MIGFTCTHEGQEKKAATLLDKIIADSAHPFHAKAVILKKELWEK